MEKVGRGEEKKGREEERKEGKNPTQPTPRGEQRPHVEMSQLQCAQLELQLPQLHPKGIPEGVLCVCFYGLFVCFFAVSYKFRHKITSMSVSLVRY